MAHTVTSKKVVISVRVNPRRWDRFRALCRRRGVSRSEMVDRLIALALTESYDPMESKQ